MALFPILALAAAPFAALIVHEPDFSFPEVGETRVFTATDASPFPFNEAIVSWNVTPAAGAHVTVEAQAITGNELTKWYTLAEWELDDAQKRTSINGQADDRGDVFTDTLHLKELGKAINLRFTLRKVAPGPTPKLKLVTVSFADTNQQPPSGCSPSPAWGKTVDVPQRAQGNYPQGGVLCSPTTMSMLLWHYSGVLKQPQLDQDVPIVQSNVWDLAYNGAGNWAFNTAYVGSFSGLMSYATRFRGIQDLEPWIDAGFPVGCSVSLDLLKGEPKNRDSGHLVILVGFEKNGDPIFNDPAWKDQVRRTYKRENFERAWLNSHRTVYIVHPDYSIYPDAKRPPQTQDEVWFCPN